jgi:hypothetical protein
MRALRTRWVRSWSLGSAVAVLGAACSIYDASLLEPGPLSGMAGLDSGGSAGSSANDAAPGTGGVGASEGGASGTTSNDGSPAGSGGAGGSLGNAGSAGSVGSGGNTDAGCASSRPVERVFGAPDGGAIALRAALSDVDLGDDPASQHGIRHRTLGYDIDGLCSMANGASCPAAAWPTMLETERPLGVDNSAGALFERLADGLSALSSSEYTARVRAGRGTMFLRVDGYNGGSEDAVVTVSLARTVSHVQPAWRGTDLWQLAEGDHDGAVDRPRQLDTRGYVAGGVVVARFPALVFRLPNPDDIPLDIVLSRVVVTCRIEPNQAIQPFQARGCVLSGAWHYKDALRALKAYPVPDASAAGRPLCRSEPAYPELRTLLCERVDLTAVGGSVNPCDALSFALRFETVPAFLDTQALGVLPAASARCSSPEDDPALDGC